MNPSKLRARYWRIVFFFGGVTLNFIFWEIFLPRIGLGALSRRTLSGRYTRIAIQFRTLAIQMGGLMIKVGQFLSARLDILPPEVTDQLSGLQDEVPAESFDSIRKQAEAELGATLPVKFAWFDEAPLAAASLGQAHRARLFPKDAEVQGFEEVVVKVQRPYIEQVIEVDLAAMRRVGSWLKRYKPISDRADIPALIVEFSSTIRQEVDYLAEGRNAETFAANFKARDDIHLPKIVWSHATRRVLTLENVAAIKIGDYSAITAAGIDRGDVARRLFDIYLQQIFEDGFFHADPHPGNLFVTPLETKDADGKREWRLTFIDFGMVGRVPENLRDGLRDAIIAIGTRDAARLVSSYKTLGVLLPGADTKLIELASAQVFDRFWGKTVSELRSIDHAEMMKFGLHFRELMFSMPFQLPQDLLFLGRTLAILSGMCSGLDPHFNVWGEVAPYAAKVVSQEGTSNWRTWLDEAGKILQILITLPGRTERVLTQMERGELSVQTPQLNRQVMFIEKSLNRLVGGLIFCGLLIAGAILYSSNAMLGQTLMGGAGLALFWTIFFARGHHPWR